jgi:hypothetical protein
MEMVSMIKDIIKTQMRRTGFVRSLEIENQKLEVNIKNLENEVFNLRNEIEDKKKILEKFATIPDFQNLNRSLKGKDGYLFLVNDSNNEIRQHYDQTYLNKFNETLFKKILNSRHSYCNNNNIKYFFFMVPDKSYVCRELLPFDIKFIKRNYNKIENLVPDFSDKLDPSCYWKTDTHINFLGGKEITYNILNHIDPNINRAVFDKLIDEQMDVSDDYTIQPACDLVSKWSYSKEELEEYLNEKQIFYTNKYTRDLENIPEKFKFNSKRQTYSCINSESFTDKRVLIFRDSSTEFLKNIMSIYPKEQLCYWDHWCFNKELIEWYKPDIILEIRTERLLDNMENEIGKRKKLYNNHLNSNLS